MNGAAYPGEGERADDGAEPRPRWAAYVTPEGEEAELTRPASVAPAAPGHGVSAEGAEATAEQRRAVEMPSPTPPSFMPGSAAEAPTSTIHTEVTAEWPIQRSEADAPREEWGGAVLDDQDSSRKASDDPYPRDGVPHTRGDGVPHTRGDDVPHTRGDDAPRSPDEPAPDVVVPVPWRRPRFRERPRGWWVLALAGQYTPAAMALPGAAGALGRAGMGGTAPGVGVAGLGPADAVGAPAAPATVARSRARTTRGLIAAALALVLLGLALGRVFSPASTPAAPVATPAAPTVPPVVFAPVTGPSLVAKRVLGAQAALAQPHAAAVLPDGRIVVADTANSRLVILGPGGRLLRSIHPGPNVLGQPYAIVAHGGSLYVLDSARAAIERYSFGGTYMGDVLRGPALGSARGLAIGPDGSFYVANPLNNSIQVVAANGTLAPAITSPLGAGPGQFNQPSDVAVGPDGVIYVMDSQNGRIEALTRGGAFVAQWPAPHVDTLFSSRLLLLPSGRIILSDPSGALLLYAPGGGAPTREAITVAGQGQAVPQPLGLALLRDGSVLAADGRGNQLLVVTPT